MQILTNEIMRDSAADAESPSCHRLTDPTRGQPRIDILVVVRHARVAVESRIARIGESRRRVRNYRAFLAA